ncbi:MAG TPA: ankyrin repeat domain-containing protein [Edaphobacter sp.]|jgi:ankyrin repeat protein/mono/diheme cytochrome c family protein|nr:ankyrin repeat domain-containing protein [Edaphobacter sp.]
MEPLRFLAVFLSVLVVVGALPGQAQGPVAGEAAAKVDFAKDVQPLLRQNCIGCHGPMKQSGGMRLDRKSSALKARRIVPGSSANSFVYHRVTGTEFGAQMPPTGDLRPEEVATIKNWIDQGAEWPDALSNEVDLPPPSAEAVAMVGELRDGNLAAFMKAATAKPALLNARGPEGSTPFMYAVLYANAATLAELLKMGADVNAHNDANATALMWAAKDMDKTRVLVEHGAEVNVRSDDLRTPLMIAARKPGGAAIVKYLLEKGANPNPNPRPDTASSPLLEAATAGDVASFELLLTHGATIKADGEYVLAMAVMTNCDRCVDLAVAKITDKDVYTAALQDSAFVGDTRSMQMMLDHGADVKAFDVTGRTALMYAAASDALPLDAVKLLVAHGADVNARSRHTKSGDEGITVLDMAKRHGKTPVLEFLVASGAKESPLKPVVLNPRFKNEIRGAVQDSLPLLQRADANFATSSGCVSCHNNSLTAMTVGLSRKRGFRVDEKTASTQLQVNAGALEKTRDMLHQGFLIPVLDNFSENVVAYILLGLHAEGYKADLSTDAAAMHILWRQQPTGEWFQPMADTRQPLCLNHIGQTALSLRALQLYMPKTDEAAYRRAIQMGALWLANAKSYNNDDRSWRVAGLAWAGTNKAATAKAVRELLAAQKPDGGWSDLATMESTAYATGKSLVALHTAGLPVSDAAYKRGIEWLLSHQQQDGSWWVQTRALAFQPSFDAGFPHEHDQWISTAATNWATMALTLALPEGNNVVASRVP